MRYDNFEESLENWQEIDLIVSRDCSLRCSYCLPAGTKIKTLNYEETNIENLVVGDKIFGFDEYSLSPYSHRKTKESTVMAINKRIAKTIKIKTENNEVLITEEHPILNSRGQSKFSWRPAGKYRVGQSVRVIPQMEFIKPDVDSKDYKVGYFLGIMMGDGSYKHYTNKHGIAVYKIRVAMKDNEAIDKFFKYSNDLGIVLCKKKFNISKKFNIFNDALFANTKLVYEQVLSLIESNFNKNISQNYYQGFLSGIYDAEGSISNRGVIRICNTNINIIKEIESGLKLLDIDFIVEDAGGTKNHPNKYSVRILSPKNKLNYLKFIKSVEPAIYRKGLFNILNKSFLYADKIISIEKMQEVEVYNLETSTGTFIANNICVHNCYLQKSPDEFYDMDKIIETFKKTMYSCDGEGIVVSLYPEPWVNIERSNELISRVLEEILIHKKFINKFMISLGTNGVLLNKKIPIVENITDRVSVGVTLDGVKEQHDMYRVFANGDPSWDIVRKNILDNQKKYRIYSTKVTLGPDTLKYAYKSTLFLWDEMNFGDVNMNIVFENLWGDSENKEKLLDIFEEQLSMLADDVIKNKRWEQRKYIGLLGTRYLPFGANNDKAKPYCGATVMRSIDSDGELYPCFRLSPYALSENKKFAVKNKETERTLIALNSVDTIISKCRECPLLSNCAMCVGGAFEDNSEKSIYWRTMHHCDFEKIQRKYSKIVYDAINPDKTYEQEVGKELVDEIRKVCPRGF